MTEERIGNRVTTAGDKNVSSDALHLVVDATLLTQYVYDDTGHLKQMTDPRGHVTNYQPDADGNQLFETTTRTLAGGAVVAVVTEHRYDDQDRLTQTWDAEHPSTTNPNPTSETVYDDNGKVWKSYDALRNFTEQLYDDRGLLERVNYPDGTSEQTTYDPDGRRQYATDRRGRNTEFFYDAVGRLSETWFCNTGLAPITRLSHTDYDASGRVYQSIDANGNATVSSYDAAGRRSSVLDAAGHLSQYGYDENGNQTGFTDPKLNTTTYGYDLLNRRAATIFPVSTVWTGVAYQPVVTGSFTAYDELGRRIGQYEQAPVSDPTAAPQGQLTRYVYDPLGRLTDVVQPAVAHHGGAVAPAITHYDYDELGNQLTQIDAEGHTTGYSYDNLGRRLTRTLPAGQSESMQYDVDGNLRFATDFNRHTTEYQYDAMNRLRFRIPDASLAEATVEWRYTLSGQRDRMIDGHGTTVYGYDDRDRLQSKTSPEGVLTYGYDNGGDVASITSATQQGAAVTYGYDALNRLKTVTDRGAQVAGYGYDDNGNLGSVTLLNGLSATYGYDPLNRLTALTHAKTATPQTPIVSYGYGLFATGQRRAVQEGTGRTCLYGYDNLWRLTGETISGDSHQKNGALGYTYDAVGNRQTRTSTVSGLANQGFSYDADDRVQGDGYDANGNTKYGAASQPASAFASQPSTTNTQPVLGTDTYDSQNRLTARAGTSGAVQVTYDGDGNKVQETVTQNNATTSYLIDDRNPSGYAQVLEEKTNGVQTRVYTWGLELIAQDQILGGGGNAAWVTSYYGYDGHGNVRFLSDANGTITDSYDYDAFGNLLNIATATLAGGGSASPILNTHLYCGEQYDGSLGMYFLRARLMNPLTGRFWTMDSYEGEEEDPASLHRYSYCTADPVNRLDPTGFFSTEFGDVAHEAIIDDYDADHPEVFEGKVTHGRPWEPPYSFPWQPDPVKPDIVNFKTKRYGEIKPFSIDGIAKGLAQITKYSATFGPLKFKREKWPKFPQFTAIVDPDSGRPTLIVYFNWRGIIFYTDALDVASTVGPALSVPLLYSAARASMPFSEKLLFYRQTVQKAEEADEKVTTAATTAMTLL